MATRNPRFSAIPNIPQTGLADWQFHVLTAMKENIELLVGARGSNDTRAVLTGQITVSNPPNQIMKTVTAEGTGFTINGVTVPSLDDYGKLILDVQKLADDVSNLRATLNTLINQLKG